MNQNGRGQVPLGQSYEARRLSPNRTPMLPPPKLGNGGNQRPQQGPPAGYPGYPDDSPQNPASYPVYTTPQNLPQQQYPMRPAGLPSGSGTNVKPPRGSSVQPQSRSGSTPIPQAKQQRPITSQVPQVSVNSKTGAPAAPPATAATPVPTKTGPRPLRRWVTMCRKKIVNVLSCKALGFSTDPALLACLSYPQLWPPKARVGHGSLQGVSIVKCGHILDLEHSKRLAFLFFKHPLFYIIGNRIGA